MYQTAPLYDYCANYEELPQETNVQHEILYRLHPDGGSVRYLGLTSPAWDNDVEYHTFQSANDGYLYYYDQESLEPVWRSNDENIYSVTFEAKTFTDDDFE